MMALPDVQRVTHFNNWVVAHAHIGVFGFAGMIALGGLYYVLPKISGKPIYSLYLVDLQYWLVLIGISGFMVVLTIVGLIQGNAWLNGETVYRILPQVHIYYVARVAVGFLIAASAYIGLYNVVRTLYFNPGVNP
jgi:cytochrome c oxidase cbb3-type subunit 1/cytochrome c oxidase cbb3-type subunit I/II